MLRKKRYFAVALFLVVVILLTSESVSRLAQQRNSEPSPYVGLLRPDFPDCPTLCWHGLRVGETNFEDAYKIVAADPAFKHVERPAEHMITWQSDTEPGFYASAFRTNDENRIAFISFTIKNLTVRDAIALWGTPIGQSLSLCAGADSNNGEIKIHFKGNMRINVGGLGLFDYIHATDSAEIRLSSNDRVQFVRFFSSLDHLTDAEHLDRWEGFRGWKREVAGRASPCGM
jgi:hypothetical protein